MAKRDTSPYYEIEIVIDIIYVVDIVFGFLTSYINSYTGDEIFGLRLIAKNYLASEFLVDFLSTFYFFELIVMLELH